MGDPRPLVIGLGNEHRHDDRCGLDVVRSLRSRLGVDVELVEAGDDPTDLLDLWEDRPLTYVVDAVRSDRTPGTVHRFEVTEATDLSGFPVTSTHGLSLGDAIRLGRTLGRRPGRLVIYGIEAETVEPGSGLSPAVARAVEDVVWRLAEEIVVDREGAHA